MSHDSIASRPLDKSALAARRDKVRGLGVFSRYSLAPVHSRLPVVLVHGMVVASVVQRPALQRVGNHHRVHAPDLPGYGRSDKPQRTPSVGEQGQVLAEWMEAVGLASGAVVVGVSLGTQVASALAAARPELVRGLILASPTMDPDLRSRPAAMIQWVKEFRHELPMAPLMLRDYLRAGARRAEETLQMALSDHIEDRLPGLAMPALVLHGEVDHLASRAWAERVASLLPNGSLIEVPDAAHAMNFSAPDEFARLVVAFTSELEAKSPTGAQEVAA
jgi:2-hydroxy-6-oxonona-2,4-dienedioate hydrolase